MSDETVIIRKTPPSFAYLFWLNGVRRDDHVMLRSEGTTLGRSGAVEGHITISEWAIDCVPSDMAPGFSGFAGFAVVGTGHMANTMTLGSTHGTGSLTCSSIQFTFETPSGNKKPDSGAKWAFTTTWTSP